MSKRIVTPEWIAIQRRWHAIGVTTPANMLHALDEVVRLRAENAALRAAVERVLALHEIFGDWCDRCNCVAPCATIAALEGTP